MLAGLTTAEIARAFLTTVTTIQQRIVRAKRTLAEKKIAYEVPSGAELSVRLASVLEVIYLISTKAIRRPRATTGCVRRCATTRSASAACSPALRRMSRKCTASLR